MPEKRLICAVIIRMLQDWECEDFRPEIRESLQTMPLANWIKEFGLCPSTVLARIESGQFDASHIRAPYR